MKIKAYHKAPLPFVGQKRFFLKEYRKLLETIPNDGEGYTIIDVFGGSGLLANNAKAHKPKARVIYNDYDGYAERLKNIHDINRLRKILYETLQEIPYKNRIAQHKVNEVLNIISRFDGYIDARSVSTWLLFSGKQISHIDELKLYDMYNSVRSTDYTTTDDYLTGLEITSLDFQDIISQHYDNPKAILLLDPPYVSTQQQAYALSQYFGMIKFLILMKYVRPPYIFFSSTRSELLDYMQYIQEHDQQAWQRIGGFKRINLDAHVNCKSHYEDNMLYKLE